VIIQRVRNDLQHKLLALHEKIKKESKRNIETYLIASFDNGVCFGRIQTVVVPVNHSAGLAMRRDYDQQ
jgi:hypothetical protein